MPAARPGDAHSKRPHRKKHRRKHRVSRPLAVSPPLGQGGYVFPVVGASGYGDSYGAFRGDVRGKWHHGDDIFAPLGAPVVAVADGTINRVGWRKIGGWRLWVRDTAANQFYFAHLSGYAPRVFHSRHVRAGDVLGFVGTTGDAFGGAPHLHFEIHPHQLLRLRYDGAVDPTTYLASWHHVQSVDAPFPVHPRLPRRPRFRSEARQVFRQLLVARRLLDQPSAQKEQPEGAVRAPPSAAATHALPAMRGASAMPSSSGASAAVFFPLLAALLGIAVFAATPVLATIVVSRRLRRPKS